MRKKTNTSTAAWKFQVWVSFVASTAAMITGILYLPVDLWTKGFFAMGLLFTVGSCFSLAKTIRDEHEMNVAEERERPKAQGAHPFRNAA